MRQQHCRIVIASETNVYVYTLSDYRLVDAFDTAPNPRGVLAASQGRASRVIAFLHTTIGHIQVQHYG